MVPNIRLDRNQRRVVLGTLLAASFFLVEAGIIEILLGMDQHCRQSLGSIRLAPDPYSICMPEWQWLFMHAASRGIVWLFSPTSSALLGGLIMGVIYALIGAMSVSMFRGRAWIVYLAIHLVLIASIAGLSYLGRYIAF